MAGDTNSNININIDASQALAQLRALEKELTALNRALIVGTKTAAQAQAKYAQGLLHNVNATGQWTASMTKMRTASEQFATSLDRSKLSLKEYFRYGMASTRTFGRMFGNEFDTVSKLVEKRVKVLQQQYVQLGRDATGAMNALKFTPKNLNYKDLTTQLMLATQRQQIFNKLMDDGATKLLNFGKNTQWAGRQLMVGFTVPLMLFGTQAIRTFKEIETQVIRFKKVYGDIFTDQGATDQALKNIRALADEYTKYGVKVSDTIKLAADAAAAGNYGKDLEKIVDQTNKLAVLGGVTQEKALETTISLKNAFGIQADELSKTIDFLNAVENQTVVSLDDLTEAIPRVAPVVKQLGGDIKDLSFFMAAMQEGGISAAQGANALKSGLGSLINPSKKAAKAAAEFGINIKGIVEANQGNLRNIVVGFAKALEPLTDLQRTRIIEDVFGKYQFARISALLNNVTKEGTQAARVLQLTNASVEELAILSKRELGVQANSSMNKFVGAVERFKAALAPVGELFAKTLTPIIEFMTRMFERFNKLPDGFKKGVAIITAVVGGLGPVFLMTFGLLANALANTMKGFNLLRKGYQSLSYGSSDAALKTQYLSQEELENISVTNALYTAHDRLSAAYKLEQASLASLIAEYSRAKTAMSGFAASSPGMFMPGGRGRPPMRRAGGGSVTGPGTATSDSIPAYLSNGEYVINADAVQKYGVGTFDAMNAKKFSRGGLAMRNGVPRLFMGGWMNRIVQNMMPRTRFNVVPADGFAISGFSPASRIPVKSVSSTLTPQVKPTTFGKIPWEEDPVDKSKLIIRDPQTGQTFSIAKSSKSGFEKMYDDLVAQGGVRKRGDRPAMSAEEYLVHRLFKKFKQGKPLTPQNVLGQAGTAGKERVRVTGASKGGAYSRWKDSVGSPKVRALQQFFDSEKNHLRATLSPQVFSELEKNNLFVVSPSHITAAGRGRGAGDWSSDKILRDTSLVNFGMNYLTRGKRLPKTTPHPTTQREADQVISYLESMKAQGPLNATLEGTLESLKYRKQVGFYDRYAVKDTDLGLKMGGYINKYALGAVSVGMPKAFAQVQRERLIAEQIDARVRSSRFRNVQPTDFGVKIKDFKGHSFSIPGIGGVYRKPNGDVVVVKPMDNEKVALSEVRAQALIKSRKMGSPSGSIKVMRDPTDPARKRRILVVESPYEEQFAKGGEKIQKNQFFKQFVSSLVRGDKDLSPSNISGKNVIDPGTNFVFDTASGNRDYSFKMRSMAEQALINTLGIKGGAKRYFAESTSEMIRSMSRDSYQKAMIKEINASISSYEKTIKTFKLTKVEQLIYKRVVDRLKSGLNVDWGKYYDIHAGVKPKKYADGVFSVPGPKGAGDVVPAMLSPGEAVIPVAQSQKYQPLIRSIVADNVPGYAGSNIDDDPWSNTNKPTNSGSSRLDRLADRLAEKITAKVEQGKKRGGIAGNLSSRLERAVVNAVNDPTPKPRTTPVPPNVANPFLPPKSSDIARNQREQRQNTNATQENTKGIRSLSNVIKERSFLNRKNLTDEQKLARTRGIGGYLRGYQKISDFEPTKTKNGRTVFNPVSAEQKINARQLMRMNRSQALMGPSMALGAAGSVAMMYGYSKPDSMIGQNLNAIMAVTALASILPMLNSPIKMLIAGTLGLIAVFKMQSAQIKQNILDGRKQGQALVTTTSDLEEFGKLTNKVSITQTAEEKRKARVTQLTPVSMEYGNNFLLNTDFGKKFEQDFQNSLKTFVDASVPIESLANKLATAVAQGVLSPDQADSIAMALTRKLNDPKFEIQVRSRLIQLLGPNGEDILKNPVEVQVKLIESNKYIQQQAFENFQKTVKQQRGGLFGVGGNEAKQLALGVAPAFGAGVLGMGTAAQISASKYTNTGYNLAKAAGNARKAQQFAQISELARDTGKVGMAINAVRAIRTGAAVTGVVPLAGWVSAAVGTVITTGIEVALRKWQVGQEKKAVGKAAGIFAAVTSEMLKSSQAGIDALNAEINTSVENLKIKKMLLKNQEEKNKIDAQIADLERKRNTGIETIKQSQSQMLQNLTTQYSQVGKSSFFERLSPLGTGRGQVRDKFMQSYSTGLQEKFKGNAGALAQLTLLNDKLDKLQNDELTLQIHTLIDSDVLTPEQASLVVSNLSDNKKQARMDLETIVKVHGTEGLQRLGTIMQFIPDETNRKELMAAIRWNNPAQANNIMSAVEEFIKLPTYLGFDINLETQPQDEENLKRIGSEINALKSQFPDGKVSLKLLTEMQEKVGAGKNKTLDQAIAQWKEIGKLDKNVQLQAIITIATVTSSENFDKMLEQELKVAFSKENTKYAFVDPKTGQPVTNMFGSKESAEVFAQNQEAAFNAFKNNAAKVAAVREALINKLRDQLFPKSPVVTPKAPGPATTDTGKGPDTSWLEDLLQKLKLFKETTIDATGTYTELLAQITKFYGPGGIASVNPMLDKQAGAIRDIEKAAASAGITISSQFMDFIKGMDAKQFEDFANQFLNKDKAGNILGFKGPALTDAQKDRGQKIDTKTQTLFGQINEAFKTGTIVDFIENQKESLKETRAQIDGFKILTDQTGQFKLSAADAFEILKDPKLAADMQKGIFSKEEMDQVLNSLKQTKIALSELARIKLNQQTEDLVNQTKALEYLTSAGVDYDTALKMIENDSDAYLIAGEAAAQAGNKTKVLSDYTKQLTADTLNYVNALNALENTKFFKERTNAIQLKKDFADIVPTLDKMGVGLEDINTILSNPNLAKAFIQDLKDGKLDAEQLKKYLDEIPQEKTIDLKISLSTREGQEQAFDNLYNKAMEYFDILQQQVEDRYEPLINAAEEDAKNAQKEIDLINKVIDGYQLDIDKKQRKIEETLSRPIEDLQNQIAKVQETMQNTIERPIELLNRQIEKLQRKDEIDFARVIEGYQRDIELLQRTVELQFDRKINALQEESSVLSNDLTLIDQKANDINDKYELQQKTLTQISEINQQIIQQQQEQIDLADALTQGDISAAAKAAQQIRSTAAQTQSQSQSDVLNAAKQAELDALRSSTGMTRKQIEDRQFAIGQQIYNLEQQRKTLQDQILIKEDLIYQKEQDRLPIQQQIRDYQDQVYKLESARVPLQDQIYVKEQAIAILEKDRELKLKDIRDIEDIIYNIRVNQLAQQQTKLDKANDELKSINERKDAELKAIDAQMEKWRDAKLAIDSAKIANGLYNDVITLSNVLVSGLSSNWADVADGILAATKALLIYNSTLKNQGTVADLTKITPTVTAKTQGPSKEEVKIATETIDKLDTALEKLDSSLIILYEKLAYALDKGYTEVAAAIQDQIDALIANQNEIIASKDPFLAILQKDFNATNGYDSVNGLTGTDGGGGGGGRYGDALMVSRGGLIKPSYMSRGGIMRTKYFDFGGLAKGFDTIPAMLSPGEFIMSKYAVQNYGVDKLKAMNNGEYNNDSVYNYSVNVNVKSDSNANEIARAVIGQIKQIDSQRIRKQRVS